MDIERLKFPIGKYRSIKEPSSEQLNQWIDEIEGFPNAIKVLIDSLSNEQKNWTYRPGGWSIKQVVHHCADSHMNGVVKFKLALTEDTPTIRPYLENQWAKLIDATDDDVTDSVLILTSLHKKWGMLLRSLTKEQLKLAIIHPKHGQKINLAENIGIYAWHSNHHVAHIRNAIQSNGKYT